MSELRTLEAFADEFGNRVIYGGPATPKAQFQATFKGKNNTLLIHAGAQITQLTAVFDGDDATAEIGGTPSPRTGLRFTMRLGHQCTVKIGENVGNQSRTFISVAEGQSVTIGDDCMISTNVELRADDSHAIYDVATGNRSNLTQSIHIGNHVWLGKDVAVMGGAVVGDGSVVGFRSIVTKKIPNNCIAVGAPARVTRRNIAWERPMISTRKVGAPGIPAGHKRSAPWWKMTDENYEPAPAVVPMPRTWFKRAFGTR